MPDPKYPTSTREAELYAALHRAGRVLNRAGWVDESQAALDALKAAPAPFGCHGTGVADGHVAAIIAERDYLRERERHFAKVLGIPDGGRYRNDWDSRLRALIDRERGTRRTSAPSPDYVGTLSHNIAEPVAEVIPVAVLREFISSARKARYRTLGYDEALDAISDLLDGHARKESA